MSVPVLESATSFADGAAATTRNIAFPASIASGDLLLLWVAIDTTATITTPTGFTQVFNSIEPEQTNFRGAFYTKTATGSESGNLAIDTTSELATGVMARITGWHDIGALSIWGGEINAIRSPGIVPALNTYANCTDGSLALHVYMSDDGTQSITATPTGATLVATVGAHTSGTKLSVYEADMASEGHTGHLTWTTDDNAEEAWTMVIVVRGSANEPTLAQPVMLCQNALHPPTLTQVDILKPYGTEDGDTLLLLQASESASVLSSTGFTDAENTNNGGVIYLQAAWKIAATEGDSYTVASSSQTTTLHCLQRWINCHATTPVLDSNTASGTSATPTQTDITPSVNNCAVVTVMACDDDEVTVGGSLFTGHTGLYSESNDEGGDIGMVVDFVNQTTAEATGADACSIVGSEEWLVFQLVMQPPGAAANPSIGGIFFSPIFGDSPKNIFGRAC